MLIDLKATLQELSVENKGTVNHDLLSSHNVEASNVNPHFRKFCIQLRTENNSRLEELSLLGNMASLNFVKALVADVRHRELTRLKRICVDERYLTQMDMFDAEMLGKVPNSHDFATPSEITSLLMKCPVLLVGTNSN